MSSNDYFLVSLPLLAAVLVASMAWIGAKAAIHRSNKVFRPAPAAFAGATAETYTADRAAANLTEAIIGSRLYSLDPKDVQIGKTDLAQSTSVSSRVYAEMRERISGAVKAAKPYNVVVGNLTGLRSTENLTGTAGSERAVSAKPSTRKNTRRSKPKAQT
ncbi:hypothetical protein [Tardiphaga sp.]|uniref:hypothetical protein n=1 Tax=Tardiphaga sp. TaxID=1926292 RepID=UPI002627493F|nr:hypothetical protein [Tardiphaga sp.]MDB5616604.1 hypothetical protein [Tardiphaga sp.]